MVGSGAKPETPLPDPIPRVAANLCADRTLFDGLPGTAAGDLPRMGADGGRLRLDCVSEDWHEADCSAALLVLTIMCAAPTEASEEESAADE